MRKRRKAVAESDAVRQQKAYGINIRFPLLLQTRFIPFPFCFLRTRLREKLSFFPFSFTKQFFQLQIKSKIMNDTKQLANLMRLSWEVQRAKKFNRSRSLRSAWAILLTEEITVFHLVRKHRSERTRDKVNVNELSLFNH